MSDAAITTTAPALPQAKRPERALRVKGKLVNALKAIVWEGQDIAEAAKTAGMTGHAVRIALTRPHVLAFLRAEREVLHAYARAQNIHHAVQMRDKGGNEMAKLGAMKFIEQRDETPGRSMGSVALPGLTIQIVMQSPQPSAEPRDDLSNIKVIDADRD